MSMRSVLNLAIIGLGMNLCTGAEAAITHVTHNLNLRSGPHTAYPPISIIPAGAAIDVLDCGAVWCHVHWASHIGYVNGYYLMTHATVVVTPFAHVHHHVVHHEVVHHEVIHHHVVKTCKYLFC